MSTPAEFWERCPVCRARLKDMPHCPRCGLDFTPVLTTDGHAKVLAAQARHELKGGLFHEAFRNALQATRMHATQESVKLLALAALAQRNFPLALSLRQACRALPGTGRKAVTTV